MTDQLTNQKSLTERFKEYLAAPKDNLRAKLINAVGNHTGWEESAIAIVDDAIMPVLLAVMQELEFLKQIGESELQTIEDQAKRLHEARELVQRMRTFAAAVEKATEHSGAGNEYRRPGEIALNKMAKEALRNEVTEPSKY